jgi:hypothetical protein
VGVRTRGLTTRKLGAGGSLPPEFGARAPDNFATDFDLGGHGSLSRGQCRPDDDAPFQAGVRNATHARRQISTSVLGRTNRRRRPLE